MRKIRHLQSRTGPLLTLGLERSGSGIFRAHHPEFRFICAPKREGLKPVSPPA
ncbi:hypothetical protein SAMN04488061_3681 [Filomicrobium insigne]|uniref:Uncharacterized protein n=1 Tax=Filomicrobium insigne TaxID=418854 RepID=A0A1H0ULW3_9HYPH|nr:hypothetical protein SAMN04488061_3681 [Filomicrobium insigne]